MNYSEWLKNATDYETAREMDTVLTKFELMLLLRYLHSISHVSIPVKYSTIVKDPRSLMRILNADKVVVTSNSKYNLTKSAIFIEDSLFPVESFTSFDVTKKVIYFKYCFPDPSSLIVYNPDAMILGLGAQPVYSENSN